MDTIKSALHISHNHGNDHNDEHRQESNQLRPNPSRGNTWTSGQPAHSTDESQHVRTSSNNSNSSTEAAEEDEQALLPHEDDEEPTVLEDGNSPSKKKNHHRISLPMPPLGAEDIAQAVLRHRRKHNPLYRRGSLGEVADQRLEVSKREQADEMRRAMAVDWDEKAEI